MKSMKRLKREATMACKWRGHSMKTWENTDNPYASSAECRWCGKWVQVLGKPMANKIDIGGPAVALSCEDRLPASD